MKVEQMDEGYKGKKPNPNSYGYWQKEISAANKRLRNFRKQGDKINKAYVGKHGGNQAMPEKDLTRLNLFHSNVETLLSIMYGNLPQVDVSRRWADSNDDVARVCAEMLERLLNLDTVANAEDIETVMKATLYDRLTSGLGTARVRYSEKELPNGRMVQSAPVDYVHWGDIIWSWARTWSEVTFIGFKNYVTYEDACERWSEDVAKDLEYKNQTPQAEDKSSTEDSDENSNHQAAEIYEIWCKKTRKVYYVCLGYDKIIETKPDPLGLNNFYPIPPFLAANVTTSLYVPTADYKLAEDLYNEIDLLSARIAKITEAVRVAGVYDNGSPEIAQMLNQGIDNKLIPVDKWAMLSEKGGLAGVIDWFPVEEVVRTLEMLRIMRQEAIGLLQQVTGMADPMRGELSNQYEGVGQTSMKTKFGSTRVQALQEDFAKFVSNIMQLKAEVVSKFYEPSTIIQQSNMGNTFDAENVDLVNNAVALLKSDAQNPRVVVRSESIAMVDYAQMKQERTEFLNAIGAFLNSASPLMQEDPAATPTMLKLLQWGMSGFKGASEIEGVLDKAIEDAAQKAKQSQEQPEQPDPAIIEKQMEMQLEGLQHTNAMELKQLDMQADAQQSAQEHQQKMAELMAQSTSKQGEIQSKFQADLVIEQIQSQNNIKQTQVTGQVEVMKDEASAAFEIEKEQIKAEQEINKIAKDTNAKISQEVVKGEIQARSQQQQQQASENNDDG